MSSRIKTLTAITARTIFDYSDIEELFEYLSSKFPSSKPDFVKKTPLLQTTASFLIWRKVEEQSYESVFSNADTFNQTPRRKFQKPTQFLTHPPLEFVNHIKT